MARYNSFNALAGEFFFLNFTLLNCHKCDVLIISAGVKSENFSFFRISHSGPFLNCNGIFSRRNHADDDERRPQCRVYDLFYYQPRDLFVLKCSAHTAGPNAFQRPPREWLVIIYFDVYAHMTNHFFTLFPAHAYCRRRFAGTV